MNPATNTLSAATASDSALYSRAEQILLPGLALGVAGDYLLRDGPVGPGLFMWLSLLTLAALWLTREAGAARRRTLALWSAAALAAAAVTAVRDLEMLIPAMLLVILLCAVLTALATSGVALRAARVRDYFFTGFSFPLQMLTWTPRLLKQVDLSSVTRSARLPGVVRGILLALPVLMLFGALFASADAGFSRFASSITNVVSPEMAQHVLLVVVFGWIGTSLLGIGCRIPAAANNADVVPAKWNVGATETHIVLALLSALFVAFVLLQLGYLFGGSDVIVNTSGLTVAEYARRGFFELVMVAALTLGLLLALDATDCARHVLRRYGTVLIVCVLIILASALQRLFLYTDAFGMTIDRFSAVAVMLWQAFNLVSFAFTVLRGRSAGFASALVISGIGSLFILALANPAAVVARINLERAVEQNRELDIAYLRMLGADAVPAVLANYAALASSQQCEIARGLLSDYPLAMDNTPLADAFGWRRWNAARAAATEAVAARGDDLYAATGLPRAEGRLLIPLGAPQC